VSLRIVPAPRGAWTNTAAPNATSICVGQAGGLSRPFALQALPAAEHRGTRERGGHLRQSRAVLHTRGQCNS
jgi:hypothetical protein